MFTGLIEAVGVVAEVIPGHGSTRLAVKSPIPIGDLTDGESIAVSGVCLTVARRSGDRFHSDVVAETLSRTTLGRLRPGSPVNLERSLRLGDRLGGHLVQGHVDACARVGAVSRRGDDWRVTVAWTPEVRPYVARKGSVALDGVSLTVAAAGPSGFQVALIPETIARTTLGSLRRGDVVNVEVDVLARYLEAWIEHGDLAVPGSRGRAARGKARRSGG